MYAASLGLCHPFDGQGRRGQWRWVQAECDATLGFYVIGYACGEVAVALASNDGIVDGSGDEYGLR